jgi:hypothetical protein
MVKQDPNFVSLNINYVPPAPAPAGHILINLVNMILSTSPLAPAGPIWVGVTT